MKYSYKEQLCVNTVIQCCNTHLSPSAHFPPPGTPIPAPPSSFPFPLNPCLPLWQAISFFWCGPCLSVWWSISHSEMGPYPEIQPYPRVESLGRWPVSGYSSWQTIQSSCRQRLTDPWILAVPSGSFGHGLSILLCFDFMFRTAR